MSSVMIPVSEATHRKLQELATSSGATVQAVLDKAVEAYERKCFLEGLNADFARLRADPQAWQEELEERALWDKTLADGLEDE
jgi:hypothetical protein